ncbi:MAG TPA: hypothetical protein VHN14_15035 [Kofleriaceae bacterium]|nr:hypothetical protein [Kofleriaceae bacterium]
MAACAAGAAACRLAGSSDRGDDGVAPDTPPADDLSAVAPCLTIDDTAAVVVASATSAEEYGLVVTAQAASATSWATAGNEALVLEVQGTGGRLISHLVLHQGAAAFGYGMHVGALVAGEPVAVKVSALSAASAVRQACVSAVLTPSSAMGAAGEGLVNAPIFRWPVQKRFDDLPVVLGWSKARKAYQTVFTNENGGTVVQCGGGASGIQAEIARWSRAADIEGNYAYAGTPQWERCTGTVAVTTTPVRVEASHPILYYGDGHNRLFESRGGYGQTCGTGAPEKADGDLAGWNVSNPSNALASDDGKVIILRPLPVDLDALGYASFGGRREALIDRYAPWLYRITSLELSREGKIDNITSLTMSRYLYIDVRVDDVGGSGDPYCALSVSGGFKLRAVTPSGTEINSSQITAAYAGNGGPDWKRVAIPLPAGTTTADVAKFRFDAYDNDGIYLTAIGDAFIPQASGANGATLTYLRQGERALTYYVDDDSSSCAGGTNSDGPGGTPYTCTGSFVDVAK